MPSKADIIDQLRSKMKSIESSAGFSDDHIGIAKRTPKRPAVQDGFETGNVDAISADFIQESASSSLPLSDVRVTSGATEESAADETARAFKKIVAIVNVSDKSEKALRERLANAEFGQAAIDESVERAKSYGFIDDGRYAEVLIRSRVSQGKGSAGIERELKSHDIDPQSIAGWPESFGVTYDSELDRAMEVLRRNPPKGKNPRQSAYGKLVRKGYQSSVASTASRLYCEDVR